jgi:large subunit ribosomal protein L17
MGAKPGGSPATSEKRSTEMRHQKSGRKFSRPSSHRNAMFSNMLASLITYERIETTEPKAKELRGLAERTISWGTSVNGLITKPEAQRSVDEKAAIVHAVRMAGRELKSREALRKLFNEVAPRFVGRPGGFTRVLKTRTRHGDNAPMAFIELTVMAAKPVAAPAPEPEATTDTAEGGAKPKKAVKAKAAAPKAKAEAAPKAEAKPKKAKTKKSEE